MTHVEWQFGGWLREWSGAWAATGLAIVAVIGVFYVVWFYRRTMGELSLGRRMFLTALRAGVVLLLLLCLANPVSVRTHSPIARRGTVAVVVDRSASMNAPDNRGGTRLAAALRLWKSHESEVNKNFSKITYRRFAAELQSASSLDDAMKAGTSGGETHLFAALRQTLENDPAAIVCLTDGLDTTSEDAEKLTREAIRRGVPIYFVPGENRLMPGASMTVREIKAPAQVLRHTQFSVTALIEIAATQAKDLPVELWSGDTKLAMARLPVRRGRNTLSWPVEVTSGERGPMPLEFRVGATGQQQIAACTSEVVENTKVDVLYYQGALQWGYRFLRDALETDPSFRLTAILNPALRVQIESASPEQPALADLPDDVRELKKFQIIVLAHIFADRLTPRQQRALVEFARSGGGVLFISPDTSATARFSGTELEEILPVVFATRDAETSEELPAQRLRKAFKQISSESNDPISAQGHEHIALKLFALPSGGHRSAPSALFENGEAANLPKFVENAKLRAVKSGAEILAVSGQGAGNSPEVLLARQQFGSGFTAALTTDLLWRWKLSLPSSSRAVEKFWQQLLLSLTPGTGSGLRITKLTLLPSINAPVELQLDTSTGAGTPSVEAVSPSGERIHLPLQETASERVGVWNAAFTPTAPGNWEVHATNSFNHIARITFPVGEKARSVELLNLPADIAGMRQLAQSTGGAVLEKTTVFQPDNLSADFRMKRVEPLWNSGWLLGVLLGLYGVELIARRRFKLL